MLRGFLLPFFTGTLLLLSPLAAQAAGYTYFQLTYNTLDDTAVQAGGQYLAWLVNTGGGNSRIGLADLLLGRVTTSTGDDTPKKDIYMSPATARLAWADGSGTSTDIFAYDAETGQQYRVTNNQQNNQKPKVAGGYIAWLGSDGANLQVWYADPRGGPGSGTQISTGASDKNNPFIGSTQGLHLISWENENGGITYWEDQSGTPTTHTAHTPGAGCTDRINSQWVGKVAFVEDCASSDIVRVFDAGASLSSEADDTVTQISGSGQTAGSAPDVGTGNKVVWVEGTGTSSEIWGCTITSCDSTRTQVTNNSLQDDTPKLANDSVSYHRVQANGNEDIFVSVIGGSESTITNDADADTTPTLKEIGSTGKYWGAWVRTPSGESDKEIFVIVPKVTTPTGTDVTVSFGNTSQVTYPTVSAAGDTTLLTKSLYSAPSAPLTGFKLGGIPTYYDLSTTATWSGTASVCLTYNPGNFNDDKSLLQLLHYESGSWVDRTTSNDTAANNICAGVTSFSEIAFAVREPTVIRSVDPGSASSVSPTNITIAGSGFLTGPKLHLSGPGGDVALQNVEFRDKNTLTATVPANVLPGTYTLVLENRYGAGATLESAFTVKAPTFAELKSLVAAAGFNENVARGLLKHVEQAERFVQKGDLRQALKQMDAFMNELEALARKGDKKDRSAAAAGKILNYAKGLSRHLQKREEREKEDSARAVQDTIAQLGGLLAAALGGGYVSGHVIHKRFRVRPVWCPHCRSEHCDLEKAKR